MVRSPRERATDGLLTAYLINHAFSRCKLQSLPKTELQKLVFLSEKSMIDERKKGFNFRFIKLIYGPFSQELETGLGILIKTEFVAEDALVPTKELNILLEDFKDIIQRNSAFFDKISIVNETYARLPLKSLLEKVYAMPSGKGGRRIGDLPLRTPILWPIKPANVLLDFSITDEEAEDLLTNFDPGAVSELQEAMSDMRKGRTRTYEQVFPKI